jgi:putative ABC transport system substrate-binding protein
MRWLLAALFALVAASAIVASASRAQEAGRTYRLGVLSNSERSVEHIRRILIPELARQGFVEGRNLTVEMSVTPAARMQATAREIMAAQPDVVIASANAPIRALAAASPTVPIVMGFAGEDPVASGLVASRPRPGGRITGQILLSEELDPKRLTILLEVLPHLRRVAVLAPDPPGNPIADENVRELASRLGIEVVIVRVASPEGYRAAFARMREAGADAALISSSGEFFRDAAVLAGLAIEGRLPVICEWSVMARDGCLLGYGANIDALRLRTADYVVRILRGTNPADLPVEGPTVFEFGVNLRTARALGIALPPGVLIRADEVIE